MSACTRLCVCVCVGRVLLAFGGRGWSLLSVLCVWDRLRQSRIVLNQNAKRCLCWETLDQQVLDPRGSLHASPDAEMWLMLRRLWRTLPSSGGGRGDTATLVNTVWWEFWGSTWQVRWEGLLLTAWRPLLWLFYSQQVPTEPQPRARHHAGCWGYNPCYRGALYLEEDLG